MVELGELEARHDDFAKRNVQILAISNDSLVSARETQAEFPHLKIVSDAEQNMAQAFQVIHSGVGPNCRDTNAPTTILVDADGKVCWVFRPDHFTVRLSPDELLAAIDKSWRGQSKP
ncbi:MAG TPA: redoxin domain-containing protein [Gemmataceae bacterium]|jgi:peroxiredoxin|nr:redoxin domain-containing protein [Gemmataceae bacterium]